MASTLIRFLVIALFGATMAVVARLLARGLSKQLQNFTVVVFVVAALPVGGLLFDRLQKARTDPFQREIEELLTVDPVGRAWFEGRKASGLPEKKIDAEAQLLTVQGMRRLDDGALARRFALYEKMIGRAKPAACAGMERGTVPTEDVLQVIRTLEPAEQVEFGRLARSAALAEMKGSPPVVVLSPEATARAQLLVREDLARPENQRVGATLTNPGGASDQEVCEASRHLLAMIRGLKEPDRSAALRMMVTLAAAP